MAELLYSYTPNDVPFWIDVDGVIDEYRPEIVKHLLSRRFSTVRVIWGQKSGPDRKSDQIKNTLQKILSAHSTYPLK